MRRNGERGGECRGLVGTRLTCKQRVLLFACSGHSESFRHGGRTSSCLHIAFTIMNGHARIYTLAEYVKHAKVEHESSEFMHS